jgi:hypothetical protein
MILILNIINKQQGIWILLGEEQVKFAHGFSMQPSQDNLLLELDKFFKKRKISFKDLKGLILFVQEASLTQVKVFTATLNTLGWQFSLPVVGEFFSQTSLEKVLPKLLKFFKKQKSFQPLAVKYKNKPLITISKKKPKYVVIK